MRKHIVKAIIQFIVILLLAVAITLSWVGYVYDGIPLISAICLTILDVSLLLFHAVDYIIVTVYFVEKQNEKEESKAEEVDE